MRLGLPIPDEVWLATVLHAMLKARLIALLLAQRSRILRDHISPKNGKRRLA